MTLVAEDQLATVHSTHEQPPTPHPVAVTQHAINHCRCLAPPLPGTCAPHVRRCLPPCCCMHGTKCCCRCLTPSLVSPPCTAFFYNAIIILATLFAGIQRPGLQWWFLSLLVITLGVPLSWWLFYKSIFNSAQTDGATYSYIRSFMLTLLHMVGLVGGCVCVVFGCRGVWCRMRVSGLAHASPRRTPLHTHRETVHLHCMCTRAVRMLLAGHPSPIPALSASSVCCCCCLSACAGVVCVDDPGH